VRRDLLADAHGLAQQGGPVRVIGRCQHVDPVGQKDQVRLFLCTSRQIEAFQLLPARVMQADRFRQRRQWADFPEQGGALLAMLMRAGPVKLPEQAIMDLSGGDANIAQQGGVEQEGDLMTWQSCLFAAFGRHDGDPLAIGQIVHPHQIQGVRERVNDLTQIGVERGARILGAGSGGHAGSHHCLVLGNFHAVAAGCLGQIEGLIGAFEEFPDGFRRATLGDFRILDGS